MGSMMTCLKYPRNESKIASFELCWGSLVIALCNSKPGGWNSSCELKHCPYHSVHPSSQQSTHPPVSCDPRSRCILPLMITHCTESLALATEPVGAALHSIVEGLEDHSLRTCIVLFVRETSIVGLRLPMRSPPALG